MTVWKNVQAADSMVTLDGANQSVGGTAMDNAGNSANTTVTGINIDRVPPVIALNGIADKGVYPLGSVPKADCTAIDALSGVDGDLCGIGKRQRRRHVQLCCPGP